MNFILQPWQLPFAVFLVLTTTAFAAEVQLNGHNFDLPAGFTIEKVAGPTLVDRPICADFDQQGRLYVADSSGSNDPVEEQVKNPSHRIVRLEDSDGDGRFDKSVVFADRMMFPEGTLWYDGSLYVAAPPTIWKLTDTDGDGVADLREEWFQGKTLTHCANDLHGPYLGPDGWFYWCKGAYAEQTYQRRDKLPFVTKAAHIFRCRPDAPRDPKTGSVLTSAIEPVMTGGMANPVDVTFTSGGERIFTTTFLIRPQAGLRDGLIHAIYGGVYGQQRASIDGHKRTGDLMPVLLHTGAAAPCGLTRYESRAFGDHYQDNLFACLFNMRKVTRHVLEPAGATFRTKIEDFLVSDNLDFHPTDVLEDADGSLVVIDTGGWYKLCCPTAQLEKPDILGAIYRVRRTGAVRVSDARGLKLAWSTLTPDRLASLLNDARPAVQRRAIQELTQRDAEVAVQALAGKMQAEACTPAARRNAIWALTQIDHADARATVRVELRNRDETVRQAAIHSVSVRRDPEASADLVDLLRSDSSHNRRAAAEALGRIGSEAAVPALLVAAGQAADRVLEHSMIYALIEIADAEQTRAALASTGARSRRAALIALDQMDSGTLKPHDVVALLSSDNETLKATADWIVDRHLEWGLALVPYLREQIRLVESSAATDTVDLQARLARFAAAEPVQQLLADSLSDANLPNDARRLVLRAMTQAGLKDVPSSWTVPLAHLLRQNDSTLTSDVVGVLRSTGAPKNGADELVAALLRIVGHHDAPTDLRLQSLWALRHRIKNLDGELFEFVARHVDGELPVKMRATAVEILATSRLDASQLTALAGRLKTVSPLDINRLLAAFERSGDEQVGLALVDSLEQSPARSALSVETVKPRMAKYPSVVRRRANKLCTLIEAETAEQRGRLEDALSSLPEGNVRRGQEVYHSAKAACSSCHALGYLGGRVGPDLTRIARIRNQRDLLEAIVFPSASLVQNYEPVAIVMDDGRVFNGLVQRETEDELTLATGPDKEVRITRSEIEEIKRSKTSVMPAGLDKQLTPQQLADLVEFLKTRK